MSPPTTSTCKI